MATPDEPDDLDLDDDDDVDLDDDADDSESYDSFKKRSELTVLNRAQQQIAGEDLTPQVGQWYWVRDGKQRWFGCVTRLGSNYAGVTSIEEGTARIHLDEFHDECERELDPEAVIARNVEEHRSGVAELMNEIQRVTAQLGIAPRQALTEKVDAESQALVAAHGAPDVKAHKKALILAKTKTLPELFSKVEAEHKAMAQWMKSRLLPMKANLTGMKEVLEVLEGRIFTVELYAGLSEELVQIADGEPAPNDTKVHLFQRRHYMDEECLVEYEAGGMEFKDIKAFDRWLLKKANRTRILPLPRCAVAFRVRRNEKHRNASTLWEAIKCFQEAEADRTTFLYIRNGEQVFRLNTSIDFGEQLFPDQARSTLLGGGNLWIKTFVGVDSVLSQAEYEDVLAKHAEAKKRHQEAVAKWKKDGKHGMEPWDSSDHDLNRYSRCDPSNVLYDDAMKFVARAALNHNRVAVVLQGLLDRSPAFHPHPPWQLWTAAGFAAGIELVYDDSRVLTPGAAPDFEAYRAKLNESITRGSFTIGQRRAWGAVEAEKENNRYRYGKRDRDLTWFEPYGNPGPDKIAEVVRFGRDRSCSFTWERERQRVTWRGDETPITCHFTCPASVLFNVSAYKKGDFKQFYADPRTRLDYLQWAGILLAAEDFVCDKKPEGK